MSLHLHNIDEKRVTWVRINSILACVVSWCELVN